MAEIVVTLSEDDIRAACMSWAVTRVLNEGQATGCDLTVTVDQTKPTGTLNRVRVTVETERMSKPLPVYVRDAKERLSNAD